MDPTFLTRVVIENYKSIAACDVRLGPLTFLVGPNGAGKSNFLDALCFVSDSLRTSLDLALLSRGGVDSVIRFHEPGELPHAMGIRLEFRDPAGSWAGHYACRLARTGTSSYSLLREEGRVDRGPEREDAFVVTYESRRAHLVWRHGEREGQAWFRASQGQLHLGQIQAVLSPAEVPQFEEMARLLREMRCYNIVPEQLRKAQAPDPRGGAILNPNADNIAAVLARVEHAAPDVLRHLDAFLQQIVPGVISARGVESPPYETVAFRQQFLSGDPQRLVYATNMSDGTLRALGVLTALFQPGSAEDPIPVVGIEEPEAALHPAAAGLLLDAIRWASTTRQVLITSHSPDLLDDKEIGTDQLLAVRLEAGATRIGPVDEVGRELLRDHLYTAGEALRQDLLQPEALLTGGSEIFTESLSGFLADEG